MNFKSSDHVVDINIHSFISHVLDVLGTKSFTKGSFISAVRVDTTHPDEYRRIPPEPHRIRCPRMSFLFSRWGWLSDN